MNNLPNWLKNLKRNKISADKYTRKGELTIFFIENDMIVARIIENYGDYSHIKKYLMEKKGWTESGFLKLKGETYE